MQMNQSIAIIPNHHLYQVLTRLSHTRANIPCPNHPRARLQTTTDSPVAPEMIQASQPTLNLFALPPSFPPRKTSVKAFTLTPHPF